MEYNKEKYNNRFVCINIWFKICQERKWGKWIKWTNKAFLILWAYAMSIYISL